MGLSWCAVYDLGAIAATIGMKRMRKFQFLSFVIAAALATSVDAQTTAEIDAYYPDLQALYQDIHRNPELAFQEVQTAAKLAARLKACLLYTSPSPRDS